MPMQGRRWREEVGRDGWVGGWGFSTPWWGVGKGMGGDVRRRPRSKGQQQGTDGDDGNEYDVIYY